MQINNGISWWNAEKDKEKELVINGFKELYYTAIQNNPYLRTSVNNNRK